MFDLDFASIPNKEAWISSARQATENPSDFKNWEKLVQLTEILPSINHKTKNTITAHSKEVEKQLVLITHENLLINFPLLEQYWINYAEWHYKFNDLSNCMKTFERALKIIPSSLVIWIAYLEILMKVYYYDHETMIKYFERARISIGYHYYCSIFFDKYLIFLKKNKLEKNYHFILRRIIEIPQHEYLKYFKTYFSLIENANLDTIKYILSGNDLKNDFNLSWVDLLNEDTFSKLKTDIRKKFVDLYITTQYYTWKFYEFEKRLKTNYFKPHHELSRLELNTWNSYIEYVEVLNLKIATKEREHSLIKNNQALIQSVYERCLVVTGNYHFFWIKLANYYLNYNNIDLAKETLLRGIYANPIRNLKLRIRLIDLYTITLEFDKAKAIIYELLQLLPNNLEIFCKMLQVEHFTLPSNVEKLIMNKLTEISKSKNALLENQFDYLFIEMLDYSCIPTSRLREIFEHFNRKKSTYYIKAKTMFTELYENSGSKHTVEAKKDGWCCEYF